MPEEGLVDLEPTVSPAVTSASLVAMMVFTDTPATVSSPTVEVVQTSTPSPSPTPETEATLAFTDEPVQTDTPVPTVDGYRNVYRLLPA